MKKPSKVTIKTPIEKLNKNETIEHYNAVLLEDIKSKMELVIEGMEITKESIHKEVSEFRCETNQRFDMIEGIVREHSGQLQNIEATLADHGRQLADHGRQLADHGRQLTDHGRQLTDHGRQLTDHGGRLDRIETKVDKIGERLDNHETRITTLETARL